MSELHNKMIKATKWSSATELAAKLVSPVSMMVLARILTPEAFGVMVTALMIISFAEIFTDAGFQKYLIQHQFNSREELYASTNVAFWSNFAMSIFIWIVISIFCQPIAHLVGNDGRGDVIAVSCMCIPIAAFSSIQMSIYKRDFDFKALFWARMAGIIVPFIVTIPLALITKSYWSLIIGMIAKEIVTAVILTMKSPWKPTLEYDWQLFKDMFAFTAWTMIEALSIWFTSYIDVFIVGSKLNEYYVGIYRTSITTVGQIIALITAATTPILFTALSKVQDDDEQFKKIFFKFQKVIAIIIIPLGVGIFCFRNFITDVLLGDQWTQAAYFIGLWGLTSALTVVLSHYCSEIFRAKGKPRLSVINQVIHIGFLIPAVLYGATHGFDLLCELRSLVRIELIISSLILLYIIVKISPMQMIENVMPSIFASCVMGGAAIMLLKLNNNMWLQIVYILVVSLIYFGCLMPFSVERNIVFNLKKYIKR